MHSRFANELYGKGILYYNKYSLMIKILFLSSQIFLGSVFYQWKKSNKGCSNNDRLRINLQAKKWKNAKAF